MISSTAYKLLELHDGSTKQEIVRAYRKLALKYHPDRGGDEDKFKSIVSAKEHLLNEEVPIEFGRHGKIIIRGRHCVRDLSTWTGGGEEVVVAATDDGLKVKRSGSKVCCYDSGIVLSCAVSCDGRFMFTGGLDGRVCRYDMVSDEVVSHSLDSQRVVSLSVITAGDHFVAVASLPAYVGLLKLKIGGEVTTVWNWGTQWIESPEGVVLSEVDNMFRVLVGGSDGDGGVLLAWNVHRDEKVQDQWESFFDDILNDSNSDSTLSNNKAQFSLRLGKDPVYALADNYSRIAVACGRDVLLLHQNPCNDAPEITHTLPSDDVLYAVSLSRFHVAACGKSEIITIWSLPEGIMVRALHLGSLPRMCNLTTRCIMAVSWIPGKCCLVSGGYDGDVSKWFLDPELPSSVVGCCDDIT